MSRLSVVFRREMAAYFSSPLAYVFITIFLLLAGALPVYVGGFFERGQADLAAFFEFHPWLYLFLIPALSMRLWAEERKSGTIEFLMTLPLTTADAVVGKFLAAWVFAGIALTLTFPFWVVVNLLGSPDNGVILAAYIGSWLMAGAYLAIGAAISAATRNQVIAFVLSAVVIFLFLMSGLDLVQNFFRGWLPDSLVSAIATLSFLTNFRDIAQGVIVLRDLLFFLSLIGLALLINGIVINLKRAD